MNEKKMSRLFQKIANLFTAYLYAETPLEKEIIQTDIFNLIQQYLNQLS